MQQITNIINNELFYINSCLPGARTSLFRVASWQNGRAFKKADFSKTGWPIIKIAELNNGITNSTMYTDKIYDESIHLRYGDLLFSWSGNPQTSIDIYKYGFQDGWLNQHIFKVVPDSKFIDKDFFFYIMKYLKPNFTKIAMNKQTTGLGHVTIADIKRISFILPPLPIQKKIAAVLSALDDKIELNNKINQNLEQQAQALVKRYVIDIKETIGKVPLDMLCNVFTGRKNANSFDERGLYKFFTCGPEVLSINSFIYAGPAVIIAGNGAYTGKIRFYNGKFDLYQRTYACTLKDGIDSHYIYILYPLLKVTLEKKIIGGTHGSAIPYIVMSDISKFEIPFDEKVFNYSAPSLKHLIDSIQHNSTENLRLAQLRDALLPKLMSGEIDVSGIKIDFS